MTRRTTPDEFADAFAIMLDGLAELITASVGPSCPWCGAVFGYDTGEKLRYAAASIRTLLADYRGQLDGPVNPNCPVCQGEGWHAHPTDEGVAQRCRCVLPAQWDY